MTFTIVFTIILIVAAVLVFYFALIRPQSKKKKETKQMQAEMKVGDIATTIGGVVGTVCAVKDNTFIIESGADRVRVEFDKWALSTINDFQTDIKQK